MSKAEVLHDEIPAGWEPALSLRPHHLRVLRPESFGFIDKLSLLEYPLEMFLAMANMEDQFRYKEDAHWPEKTSNRLRQQEVRESMKSELSTLPDEAVLRLDFSRDQICNACVVGKHCTATNYRYQGRIRKYEKMEGRVIERLERELQKKGCQAGIDFIFVFAEQELLDYHGEKYWSVSKEPEPRVVSYNALLARMGALRKIVHDL